MSLARILDDERDRIIAIFVAQVQRQELSPEGLSRSLLVDHIPHFLGEVSAELTRTKLPRASSEAHDTSATARQHGEQRWELGYDLEGLVREYGVLRHSIVSVVKEGGIAVSLDELEILAKCLNVGIAEAATAYVAHRDGQVALQNANLEFLTEAGALLSSSLDYRSTLNRLTALLVPRLADWCTIQLDGVKDGDLPVAHADPGKVPLLRDLLQTYPPAPELLEQQLRAIDADDPAVVAEVDPDFFGRIATSPEHLTLLRAVGTRSWIVVPLKVQDLVFGRLLLAYSESNRRYDVGSVRLAREVARRAAIAIDNARLYELSQRERSRVEATTRAKDEFVAMVSHELRTPLNAILGWLRLLRDGTVTESKREHALEVIERNARTQDRLVADLLDISKVITGRIRITPSQVDLADVAEMAIEGVRTAAEAKRIRIRTDIVAGETIMRGDGDRLQQVVWNLLANAVKFTPKNGEVDVRIERIESDLQLVVRDNGEGIDPTFLPHVFESFQQSDTSFTRKYGGLGIGLSIAKHLVELHGGAITAHSDGPGRGSTFTVRLPISPLLSTTLGVRRVSATTDAEVGVSLPPGLDGLAVLVVDDDPDARELVTFVLERHGMGVLAVANVAEAMKALASFTPDVIVSDIGLPDDDGYSLIRNVRTMLATKTKNVPAIALTAFGRLDDRNRALVEGFNVHLTKPVEPLVLVRSIIDLARDVRR